MYHNNQGEHNGVCDCVSVLLLTLRTLLNEVIRCFEFVTLVAARNLIPRGACWIAHPEVDD